MSPDLILSALQPDSLVDIWEVIEAIYYSPDLSYLSIMDSDPIDLPAESRVFDEKFPNRPQNHSPTLPFHELFLSLFNPLNELKSRRLRSSFSHRKAGRHGGSSANLNPFERRRDIIERFVARWKKEVGNDIYPAFRLIAPDKDRDRAMYGIKEKLIGNLLVKIMKIDRNSEDGFNLLNWKLPGQTATAKMAGDFAGRCYDVISKRPMLTEVGNMLIEEVNEKLENLSAASKESEQLPIFADFYRRMNPEELMWLIRIILRQMRIGATERTLFDVWHPDAEMLYSISSSLRRVCWELYDPNIRLEAEDRGIRLMQCFQPQLAQFQMHSLERMVARIKPTEDDPVFWIEEKLDGERVQLHMESDSSMPGGKRFGFWSRKAKDYTYLYGNSFFDENGSLTRHLKDAFEDGVDSIILDGEMITWDPEHDAPVPFGTLKTAALSEQRNPFAEGQRPVLRVFDILYLNGRELTRYTLRDRRKALQRVVRPVHRRFEIHPYQEATTTAEIEAALRTVVAEASEGLVLKNPRSPYRLNERCDDWMKVKPEYMTEFGESLDLVVIGGYYGSGHRGGNLSSFLCGLRANDTCSQGTEQMKCYSFCKVGGGFNASDYAQIFHQTDGKWIGWNTKRPPTAYIELAGGDAQYERPDMWIKPEDSVVLSVKAASVTASDAFRIGLTLRFPRFKALRRDKDWKSSLSVQELLDIKANVEQEEKEKQFKVDNSRRKRARKTVNKTLAIAGYDEDSEATYTMPSGRVFEGLNFFIMTDSNTPEKKSKAELEQLVKSNGGSYYQTHAAVPGTICIADRRTVKVASLEKSQQADIIRPSWILDCIKQNKADADLSDFILPLEPRHVFRGIGDREDEARSNVDRFMDSYTRDVTVDELSDILRQMGKKEPPDRVDTAKATQILDTHIQTRINSGHQSPTAWLFRGLTILFYYNNTTESTDSPGKDAATKLIQEYRLNVVRNMASFGGARIINLSDSLESSPTHIVVYPDCSPAELSSIRSSWATRRRKIPRLVTVEWIEESWKERTVLDEERYQPAV